MFENVDGRTDDGRTDAGVTGILIAHLRTFGSADMGRITLESNALNYHYLPKMCIELPLPLLDFEKVMH